MVAKPQNKQAIVILHGWGLSGQTFQPLVEELRRLGYRASAPDLPGFGSADRPSYPWRLCDYVGWLAVYLTKHRAVKPVIIGHSFGGRIALKYQQLHPENTSVLILTGTPGFSPVPKRKLLLFVTLAKIGRFIFAMPPLNLFREAVKRWYYYVVGARDFFRAEGVMREIFKQMVQEELVTSMEAVAIPCLLIWGEYDIVVPVTIARRMKEVIPQAQLVLIPEADHGVPYKQPEVFSAYADRFLERTLK